VKVTVEYNEEVTINFTDKKEKFPDTDDREVEPSLPTAFTYNTPPTAAFATGELNKGAETDTNDNTDEL